jgi:hypothetical protein
MFKFLLIFSVIIDFNVLFSDITESRYIEHLTKIYNFYYKYFIGMVYI